MRFIKKGRTLVLISLIFLALGFFVEASAVASRPSSNGDIILNDLKGKAVNLSDYKGKPTILFFWTTWCRFCREEIKTLNQAYPQMKQEGVTVFAVNIGESQYAVENFFVKHLFSFEVLLDRDALLADKYDIMGVPTYILINKSGLLMKDNALPANYKEFLLE